MPVAVEKIRHHADRSFESVELIELWSLLTERYVGESYTKGGRIDWDLCRRRSPMWFILAFDTL